MTNKNTKRALLSSVLALFLCFAMLIGTTFAWFTDSVTSANNIIKSGTLNVEMYYADGKLAVPADDSTDWKNAQGVALYTAAQLWEPGYTDAKHIKISNEGTLALKYQLAIIPTGEVSELADVIDVYLYQTEGVLDNAKQVATRDDIDATMKVGTLADVISKGIVQGNLAADTDYTTTIVLKMQEGAGNEYQNKSIGDDFTIQLLATQLNSEKDSFDTDYDKDAWVTGMKVYTASDLQAAINAGETNIQLMNDITLDETIVIPASTTRAIASTVIDLNGKTITGNVGRDADGNRVHVIVNNGNAVIKNGVITSAGVNGGSAIYNADGATLTVENVTLNGAPQEGSTWPSYTVNNYGTLTVSDSSIYGVQGIIATNNTANTTVNNVIAYRDGWSSGHVFYNSSTAKVTINGGTYTNDGNGVDGTMIYGGETVVNGGTFIVKEGAYFALCSGSKLTVNGGDFSNIKSCLAWGGAMTISGGTFGFNPTTYVADGFKAVENDGVYYVVSDEIDVVVTNPADLAAAIAQGGIVYVANDIDMNNAWTSVKPNAELTILGNGKTITNLNLPLLAGGVSTKVTFKGLTVADSNVAPAAFENGLGTGAFVPYVDAYGNVAFEDCHLVNSTVTGNERAGGFIGYTSGQTLSFKNCTVDKCEISAVGGAAGLVAYSQTATTIDGCSVTNTKVTATEDRLGTKAALAGSVIGTVNADTVINNVTASGNTVSNNNALPAFSNEIGRKVAGVLKIDGKTVVTDASNLANGGNFVLGGDVQYGTAVKDDTVIDLAGNTFEATGSYNLSNNADFTMTNGDYVVNRTYGHIDVRPDSAEGSVLTFENVDFTSNYKNKTYGTCTDRLVSVLETAPEAGAHIVVVFKNCTFDNAKVLIEGMSGGAGTFAFTFENCTFNALTSSAPIEVMNYMKGTITVKNCTFNLECTSASASAIAVSPSSSTEVTIVAENNTINATAAIASGESGTVEQVKVHGTPANIKFISAYENTTITEINTVKTGIAQ